MNLRWSSKRQSTISLHPMETTHCIPCKTGKILGDPLNETSAPNPWTFRWTHCPISQTGTDGRIEAFFLQ